MKRIFAVFSFLSVLLLFSTSSLPAQGNWEIGFHYSQWSIDILRSMIEDGIGDALETNLKNNFLDEIRKDYPNLEEVSYNQDISFDSGGDNYGFEIRWYPGGYYGSFSLGLSVEKTTMRVSLPQLSADLALKDSITSKTASFKGDASGAKFEMKPLSFHLSFRWDIYPSGTVHPYITFGVGAATGTAIENGKYSVSWSGDLAIEGEAPEQYKGSEEKTLKELKDEQEAEGNEFFLPGFLPFIQLNVGVKAAFSDNFHALLDVGIWNGFLIRGGISIRL